MNRRQGEGSPLATPRMPAMLAASLATAVALAACSQTTKFHVLSFFFDGVPPPGVRSEAEQASEAGTKGGASAGAPEKPAETSSKYFTHTAYAQHRCGSCHNKQTGNLFRRPEEGLCQTCHTDPPGRARFVHGPVAVNACLFCHHPHVAPFPGVTLLDVPELCVQCHDPADLALGAHHDVPNRSRCTECHNPHGGDNRFFLKHRER